MVVFNKSLMVSTMAEVFDTSTMGRTERTGSSQVPESRAWLLAWACAMLERELAALLSPHRRVIGAEYTI